MELRKSIATTIREYLNENYKNSKDIKDTLLKIGDKVEDYITCDVIGSCVHFSEEFVEIVKLKDEKLLNFFYVVNIKVRLFDSGELYWGDHTYIELFDGTVIDPTIKQFRGGKYNKVDGQTKKYIGSEYYEKFMKNGTFFQTIRHRYIK